MYLAPEASRLPIAFPTRVDAAMPIRKTKASYQLGVFVEDDDAPYRCQTGLCSKLVGGLKGESGLLLVWRDSLWSVVMITDCAASGTEPSLAAASATISNAALMQWRANGEL